MATNLKKAFSTFVSLTTIAWSVGAGTLALPGVASAATLSAGDLIKASGPAVYYYAADGKRYVFPNEKTYFSWYQNFNSVKTITDAELAAIMIGGNVTERAGTKLVKITTDPKVYAVTNWGVLHWVESEAVAKGLFGDNWAQRVIDVPDAFFVNYTVGSSVSTMVHPDGSLVKYANDPTLYVIQGGVKRKFASDSAFAANGLNMADVITTSVVYGNGSDVTGREAWLADAVSTTATPVGGNLTVSLASDTPAGMTVTKNASSVKLVKVNLTAGSNGVTVNGLRFTRIGVGSTSDFSNVYLYDQDGLRLTTGRSINSQTNVVEFNSLNVMVDAGMTKSVFIYGDFSSPSATGGQHSFQLTDAASVVVSGNSTVAGSFPVRGNVFTVGTESSARVDIQKGITPSNPNIGAQMAEISNFKVTANTNDVELNQVTLYQAGSVNNSDLTNLELYQGATKVATASGVASNGRIVLKFATPYFMGNGTTKVFSLKATVGGRAGRTIRTYVEYTTDVNAMDKKFNTGASICIENSSTACTGSSANFDGSSSNYVEVTTQGGQLTNSYNGPATQNIAKGQLAVPLYKFALTSPDNQLEIRKLVFTLTKTAGSAASCKVVGTSGTKYFRSIKVKNMDSGATVMGPKELAAASGATTDTLTFNDSFFINAAQTLNLAVVADLSNSQDGGDTFLDGACAYQVNFSAFSSGDIKVVSTGESLDVSKVVPNSAVTGNAQTVKASNLDIALASTPGSDTLVKKQQNVPVAALTLTASAQSDITVTKLTLAGQATVSGCLTFGGAACNLSNFSQRVTSLALYDGNTQVGLAKAPDSTTGKALIDNMNLKVAKGTTKTLTVKAAFASTAASSAPFDRISVGVAQASDVDSQDQDSNTVTPTLSSSVTNQATGASPSVIQTILNSGTLTVSAESHPVSNIAVGGKDAWMPFAQYKATAQYEDVELDRIAVLASSTSGNTANNSDFSAIAIASNGAVKGQDTLSAGTTGTKDIDLTANKIVVPKNGSVLFQVWVKLSSTMTSSSQSGIPRSGDVPAVGLNNNIVTGEWDANYATKLNIRANGAASGERVYAAAAGVSHGNGMVLRKTQPIVTKQSLSSTTLANIDQDLMKFQVAADSAGSVALKQVVFQYSKTSATSLQNFRLRRGASDLDINNYNVTSDVGVDLKTGTLAAASTTGYIVVSMAEGQEEIVIGSGNVYTLHATVSGSVSGQNVTLSFYRNTANPIVTGYLVRNVASAPLSTASNNIYHIDTAVNPSGAAGSIGTFVWSDNSEVQHSSANQTSRDWTNDVYVQDLSQSQTLSL